MTSATTPPLTDGLSPPPASRPDRLYPTLTPAQLARIAPHGRPRQVAQGEVLVHAGETAARIFVVLAGRIDVIRPSATEEVVVSFSPGMFTGEATMLSGRRGLAQVRQHGRLAGEHPRAEGHHDLFGGRGADDVEIGRAHV